MPPPKDIGSYHEALFRHADEKGSNKRGDRHIGSCCLDSLGDFAAVQAKEEDHQAGDEAQDNKGVSAAGLYVIGGKKDTAAEGDGDTDQRDKGNDIKDKGQRVIERGREQREGDSLGKEAVQEKLGVGNQ